MEEVDEEICVQKIINKQSQNIATIKYYRQYSQSIDLSSNGSQAPLEVKVCTASNSNLKAATAKYRTFDNQPIYKVR